MLQSSNPALNSDVFSKARSQGMGETMTMQGVVNKTFFLLLLVVVAFSWVWGMTFELLQGAQQGGYIDSALAKKLSLITSVGFFGGLIAYFILLFNRQWVHILGPIYAVCQGVVLGGLSAYFETQYPGIAMQAVALTIGTLFSLLLAYKSGLIKVTDKFRAGVAACVGGIFVFYMVNLVVSFFKPGGLYILSVQNTSPLSIGLSVFIVIIAALTLVLDFDQIDRGVAMGAPKYMEWWSAFGLMVSLIWLYLEILKLLAKMKRR